MRKIEINGSKCYSEDIYWKLNERKLISENLVRALKSLVDI